MGKITIDVPDTGKISDGYHTFDELYAHRILLFVCLLKSYPSISWKSKFHDDGSSFDGWFIAGMMLSSGDITYHIPDRYWDMLEKIKVLDNAPKWDGHTPDDVIKRLSEWVGRIL